MSQQEPLRLHVPEPTGRPGREPTSPTCTCRAAGAVRRPPIDTSPAETSDLAYTLVRVLDDEGRARRPVGAAGRCPSCCVAACAR